MRHQSIESYFDPLGFHELLPEMADTKGSPLGVLNAWLDLKNRQDLHLVVDNFVIDVEKSHGK
jgi:hypothetical protein